jgi:hypothetical protein
MAVASRFDCLLDDNIVSFPPRTITGPERDALLELEFSEMGRDPRFLPGWYILPLAAIGVVALLVLLIHFA